MTALSPIPAAVIDRALLWHWLADLFLAPPTPAQLGALQGRAGVEWRTALAAEPDFANAISRIDAVLEVGDAAGLASALTIAFNRMFLGLGGKRTLSPCESAWVGTRRLYQAPVSEIAALLRASDLTLAEDCCEPADHLAVELMLLAHLEASADPRAEDMAARLAGWTPDFLTAVKAVDPTGFWAGAADLLSAALARSLHRKPEERTV
ncbi:TorD/DmsD family molecular chaperone [Rhodobacter maris]|uniref:TorA-specific chaperone n=1 Tax=Rhodobacter maris TaxID=446682 RepID=A0A285SS55_9RHOB|nr:molecular chaperone TorD family protein [Rhodobacter maris]SOC09105.1 TorA-specific chaperone [Rhodobacter maris]